MSLKDRLTNHTKPIQAEPVEIEPKYYSTNEISQAVDSLGEIDTLFADDDINSIYVMGAKSIYMERKGKKSKIALQYRDNVRLENIIRNNIQSRGIEINDSYPYAEFNYKPGINVFATLPPLSTFPSMIIKCYKDKFASVKSLAQFQAFSKEIGLFIEALASLKLNIIIAGEKNTLKTTLLSAMAKQVPQNNNAVLFDYSNELDIKNPNIVTYCFKNYKNDDLIENVISTNPDKIFLNDCKDLSYFEKYLHEGYKGLCATCKASELLDVIRKFDIENIDVVIFVKRINSTRLVSSISLVRDNELKNIFYLNDDMKHASLGVVPDFYGEIEQNAIPISTAIFEADYKHTYYKTIQDDVLSSALKKNLNVDILKKFKKDLNTENNQEQNQESDEAEAQLNENNEQNFDSFQEQNQDEQNL